MNHVYKVVFNCALGVYQCVSEVAKSQGKSSGKSATCSSKSAFNFTTLSIAILGISALATAMTANATNYTSGSIIIPDSPYVVIDDVISGSETEVIFNNVVIGNTKDGALKIENSKEMPSYVAIKDAAGVKAYEVQLGVNKNINGSLLVGSKNPNTAVYTQDMIIGVNGTGDLTVQEGAVLDVDNLVVGKNSQSQNNIVNINSYDNNEGGIKARKDIIIGDAGSGVVQLNTGRMISNNQFYLGKQDGSNGEININPDNESSYLRTRVSLHVGYGGTGNLNIFDGEVRARNITLGGLSNGIGNITIAGGKSDGLFDLISDNLIIGDSGKGNLTVKNTIDEQGYYNTTVKTINAIIGNKKDSQGEFIIEDSAVEIDNNLIVGNEGLGSITAKSSIIELFNIKRNPNSQGSSVSFDDTSLWTTKANNNLFEGFDSSNPILLSNGFIIGNDKEYITEDEGPFNSDIKINPQAVFKGNIGYLNPGLLEYKRGEEVFSGFLKSGGGLVEISDKSMQWTGETAVINGTLRIAGDFVLDENEKLAPCVRIVVTPNNQVKGGNKEQRCPDTVKRENKLY